MEEKNNAVKRNSISLFLKSILLFLYIYEFNFSVWGYSTLITSRRIVVFLVFIGCIIRSLFRKGEKKGKVIISLPKGKGSRNIKTNILLLILLLLHTFVLNLLNGSGNGTLFSDVLIRQLFFGIIAIFLFASIFDSFEEFMMAVLIATIFQGIIILICLLNANFALFLDTTFLQERASRTRWGYAGGLACNTAPGCIKFSLGLLSCVYFMTTRKSRVYSFLYFFLAIISIMIARTGAVFVLVSLIYSIYILNKQKRASKAFNIIATLVFLIILLFLYLALSGNMALFKSRFVRYARLIEYGVNEEFFSGFTSKTASLPSLSLKNLFGTGTVSGYAGNGEYVNIDGGYLRIYAAVGPISAVVVYYTLFNTFIKSAYVQDKYRHAVLILFVVFLALAEFKEFTIYAQFMFCIYYTAVLLVERDQAVYEQYSNEL